MSEKGSHSICVQQSFYGVSISVPYYTIILY